VELASDLLLLHPPELAQRGIYPAGEVPRWPVAAA